MDELERLRADDQAHMDAELEESNQDAGQGQRGGTFGLFSDCDCKP